MTTVKPPFPAGEAAVLAASQSTPEEPASASPFSSAPVSESGGPITAWPFSLSYVFCSPADTQKALSGSRRIERNMYKYFCIDVPPSESVFYKLVHSI